MKKGTVKKSGEQEQEQEQKLKGTSLATKYRPRKFMDFIGNETTVSALKRTLERKDIPHTFLFTGPSGCGKTTLARIVAKKLGCGDMDLTEQNTADFRGIDSIRELLGQMRLSPWSGPVRVWILDECHQLSKDAQHALLKAIEEPPAHVFFLLATTEPEKLLPTIKTRCVLFEVKPLSPEQMEGLIQNVAEEEGMKIPQAAMEQIVQDADGSARLALSILDKLVGLPEKEMEEAAKRAAEESSQTIHLCRELISGRGNWKSIGKILSTLNEDPEKVRRSVLGYCRSILLKQDMERAYDVMACFRQDFFTSGRDGLVIACYEATH